MSVMAGVRRLVGVVAVLGVVLSGAACGGMPDEDAGSQTSTWEPPPGHRGDPLPDGVEVVQQGFTVDDEGPGFSVSAGAVLKNITDSAVAFPLTFVPLDKDGQSLNLEPIEDRTYGIVAIAAGAQVSVGLTESFMEKSLWEKVTTVEANTYPGSKKDQYLIDLMKQQPGFTLETTVIELDPEPNMASSFRINVAIDNPHTDSFHPFGFGAVYRDESGAIVGGHSAPTVDGSDMSDYIRRPVDSIPPGYAEGYVKTAKLPDGSIPHTVDATVWPIPESTEIPEYDPS